MTRNNISSIFYQHVNICPDQSDWHCPGFEIRQVKHQFNQVKKNPAFLSNGPAPLFKAIASGSLLSGHSFPL
jgi:hypothetical protein